MPLPKLFPKVETDVPQQSETGPDATIPAGPNSSPARVKGEGDGPADPADAGHVIPASLAAQALVELEQQLKAVKSVPGPEGSSGKWVEVPDYAVRQRAIELVFAYRHGKPVERQIKLTGSAVGYDDRLEKLISTPEGLQIALRAGLIAEDDPRIREKRAKAMEKPVKK